jgi:IclR family acetate operon transcriptional repressor
MSTQVTEAKQLKQVAQVLELLEFFAQRKRPAALADVCEHFGWPRSSAFNLLTVLAAHGYLYEPRLRGGYYPSPKWLNLSEQFRDAEPISVELHEMLEELARVSGETVALVAASGRNALFLDVVESHHAVRYTAKVGKLVPLHASSTGRALLSQRPEAERAAFLRKAVFVQHTPNTLMSTDSVEKEIRRSLKRGWFVGHSEYSLGLDGLALALPMPGRQYAVLIAGPVERMADRCTEMAMLARATIEDCLDLKLPLPPSAVDEG